MSSAMQTVSQHSTTQSTSQYASTGSPRHPLHQTPVGPRQSSRHRTDHAAVRNSPVSPDQFYSPTSAVTSNMNSPQHLPLPPSTHGSPVAPSTGQGSSGNTRPRPTPTLSDGPGSPPIPPPRTSSNQRSRTSSTAPSANASTERVANPKHSRRRGDGTRDRGNRDHIHETNGRDMPKDDAPSAAAKRRKGPHSPDGPQRAASTLEPRDHASPSALDTRSEASMGPTPIPAGIEKEGSTVINRMVITDPEVDIIREKERLAEAQPDPDSLSGLGLVSSEGVDDGGRGARSRHDYSNSSSRRKETTFGDYVLGQTIGEGEFGKVRLGWKRDGSVQVAIKLLRRESLGNNPSRLPKIYREISILKELSHPNIVRLHEMAETDRHIGIVLEYASGGELFDYILNHRYLKDNPARRLFAQLVSGVGYLHKKGIVHRDLKLENLMLDRNRNIIITDFGFANTFDPTDELGDEIEYNLTNREFVKRMKLDRPNAKGLRRGDLMQTSCGSPCYAAPELVVTDSLYTGRKVDVWSCGVILYAMLAGYLPFDDDPANPEGDNINLLYKYIVTTPLTFPEYVTPHARDLLRRILVPDPRKRADLFEVARHSWLAEYAHVVSHITSNTTNVADIANTTVPAEDQQETPALARSASVREPPKAQHQSNVSPVGGLSHQPGKISQDDEKQKPRDAKRRTVQVEYVPPQSQTSRGDSTAPSSSLGPTSGHVGSSQGRPMSSNREPASSAEAAAAATATASSRSKPLPKDPPVNTHPTSYNTTDRLQGRPQSQSGNLAQSISDLTGTYSGIQGILPQTTRPRTGGSLASTGVGKYDSRLPSRGSYSQPAAPAVATTNVQGRLAQPKNGKTYSISPPIAQQTTESSVGRPSTNQDYSAAQQQEAQTKSHKRSSTVSSIGEKLFGRSGSIFGGRSSQHGQRSSKRYPPTSMKEPVVSDEPRASMDSRRSISHSFHRRHVDPSQEHTAKPRRFSLLPASFSLKAFSSGKETSTTADSHIAQVNDSIHPPESRGHQQQQQSHPLSTVNTSSQSKHPLAADHAQDEQGFGNPNDQLDMMNYSAQIDQQFAALHADSEPQYESNPYGSPHIASEQYYQEHPRANSSSARYLFEPQNPSYTEQFMPSYPEGYNPGHENGNGSRQSIQPSHQSGRGSNVLQKNHRRFADAYEYEKDPSNHSGSSGAARRVMEFFRRRGKYRAGDHQ
ncbi:CAMK/CAMKL/KIN4 protein kinase [Blastomyces percursus]|uniref:non-specific serine/threonine protein kinase n=1 Tax=Blastomyces percursus TaxID=1658174 RepID=A0A1J9QPK8_9EURO|nr:CAMK/CAMKL/KIN4 protein kinase [Blastomyces percursus]